MKQQLLFDLQLLWTKKKYRFFLVILNLTYLILGMILCFYNSLVCILMTILVTSINTFVVLGIANCHNTKNHQTTSNFALCIYYPIKRWHFYISKNLLTILVLCMQMIWSTIMVFGACLIHPIDFRWNEVLPYLYVIYLIVAIGSSIIIVTCFSATSFHLGSVLTFTFIGMVCGFFVGMFEDSSIPSLHSSFFGIVALIVLGIWSLSNLLAYFISKHISV